MEGIKYDTDTNCYYFQCPHQDCKLIIAVKKDMINCKIFRHGVFKDSLKQLDPHASQKICTQVKKDDLIYGCGKPFYFDGQHVSFCGFI